MDDLLQTCNQISFWHRCLERQAFGTPRMYMLSPSKSIKGSNYGEFLKDKNVLLCTRLYKYVPNLESLLTQQYVCVLCTFWSDNTCVFTRFHSVKNANMQLIWSSAYSFELQNELMKHGRNFHIFSSLFIWNFFFTIHFGSFIVNALFGDKTIHDRICCLPCYYTHPTLFSKIYV